MEQQTLESGAWLRQQLRVLRENWLVIALCVLITTAVAFIYSATRPAVYQASAQLLIENSDLASTLVGLQDYTQSDPERESATAVELASQPVVAARVVRRLNLKSTPEALLGKVVVQSQGNSRLISVSAQDGRRSRATELANVYADEYIAFRRDTNLDQIRVALEGVRGQLRVVSAAEDTQRAQDLRARSNQLETLESLETGGVQKVQEARAAVQIAPTPSRNAVLGAVLGLLLGVGLTLLRDRLDLRIKSEDQVMDMLPGVPVIAAMPSWHRDSTPGLQSEGFRALHTAMTYLDPDNSVRSLLVTSATVGEGKTTTSLNLALAIAERDESVLVLDGDLRRCGLTERLDLRARSGVSEILLGEGEVHDYAVNVAFDGTASTSTLTGTLGVVPAGLHLENPHRLLISERVRRLLNQATLEADKVVIDGTPLGLINDMLPIAARADAVVVVVHLYHTRRNELKRLADQLFNAGISPFGLVLFGIETDRGYDAYMRHDA